MKGHVLSVENGTFAVVRLQSSANFPMWASGSSFLSMTRTSDELSIVCEEHLVTDDQTQVQRGFSLLKVAGPLDFSLVGVLSGLLCLLASVGISVFTISTFDTDYIMVRAAQLDKALEVLEKGGNTINRGV